MRASGRYHARYSRDSRVYSSVSAGPQGSANVCVLSCVRVRERRRRCGVGRESAWVACVRAASESMRLTVSERRTEWNLPPPSPETSPPQTHTYYSRVSDKRRMRRVASRARLHDAARKCTGSRLWRQIKISQIEQTKH